MLTLTEPVTPQQINELVRKLPLEQRRKLVDALLADRFSAILAQSDGQRSGQPEVTDEEIQAEIDAVRERRRQERQRAAG